MNRSQQQHDRPYDNPVSAERVRAMFTSVARRYDFLNRLLSLNLDRGWRRKTIQILELQAGERLLDLCTGTGDVVFMAAKRQPGLAKIVGVDFTPAMLEIAQQRARNFHANDPDDVAIQWLEADGHHVPLADESFDAISCAFGLRNMAAPAKALDQVYRLLRNGGRLAILEFSIPHVPLFRPLFLFYFNKMLPFLGSVIAKDRLKAYHYLSESVARFGENASVESWLEQAGFADLQRYRFTGGIVTLYVAQKPSRAADSKLR